MVTLILNLDLTVKLQKKNVWLFYQIYFMITPGEKQIERIEVSQLETCVYNLEERFNLQYGLPTTSGLRRVVLVQRCY